MRIKKKQITQCEKNLQFKNNKKKNLLSKNKYNETNINDKKNMRNKNIKMTSSRHDKNKKYVHISFPENGEFNNSEILIYTPSNKIQIFSKKENIITININDDIVKKIVIKNKKDLFVYENPKMGKTIFVKPKKINNNKKICYDDPFKDNYEELKIYSKYPYLEFEKPFIWRKFDSIRY